MMLVRVLARANAAASTSSSLSRRPVLVVVADESAEFVNPFAEPVHGPILPMPHDTLRSGL